MGIVNELTGQRRHRVYVYQAYLEILIHHPKRPVAVGGPNVGIHTARLLEVGDGDSAEFEKQAGVSLWWCPRNRQQARRQL